MPTDTIALSDLTTKKINSLLLNRDNIADDSYLQFENELLSAYKRSLVNIKEQLLTLHEKLDAAIKTNLPADATKQQIGDYSLGWAQSFNRLTNLQVQITKEINTLNANVTIRTRKHLNSFYEENYLLTGYALETTMDVSLGFGLLNTKVIQEAVQNPFDWEGRLKLWNTKLLGDIKQGVTDGLVNGSGYVETTRNIQKSFETNLGVKQAGEIKRSNILRVVRTESSRVQELGNQSGYDQAFQDAKDLNIDIEKVWDATLDSRTRPNHGAMDGKIANKEGLFNFTLMTGGKKLIPGRI